MQSVVLRIPGAAVVPENESGPVRGAPKICEQSGYFVFTQSFQNGCESGLGWVY